MGIRGELTIYEEGEPDRNYEKEVRDAHATDMTEGDFNDIHESIIAVSYQNLDEVERSEGFDDVDEDISLYVAVASGALLVCLVLYIVINMMKGDSAEASGGDEEEEEEE